MASETSSNLSKEAVLSKATLNAAKDLGLGHAELARLLGIDEASGLQLVASKRFLDPRKREGERALMLVRIFRALDALVAGDADARVAWMNSHNKAIGDLPKHAIQTTSGLRRTLVYLNSLVVAAIGGPASRLQ